MINDLPFRLSSGDMIVVAQPGGVDWDHAERRYVPGPRWNLTFRVIRPIERTDGPGHRRAYCEEWDGDTASLECPVEHTRPATPAEIRAWREKHAANHAACGWDDLPDCEAEPRASIDRTESPR